MQIALWWDILNRLTTASFNNFPYVSNSNNQILQCIRMCPWRWSRTKRVILELRVSNLNFQERKHSQLTVNSQQIIIAMKALIQQLRMDVIITSGSSNISKSRISVDWMITSSIQGIILVIVILITLISAWILVLTCEWWRMDKHNLHHQNRNNSTFNREKEGFRHNTNSNNKRQQQLQQEESNNLNKQNRMCYSIPWKRLLRRSKLNCRSSINSRRMQTDHKDNNNRIFPFVITANNSRSF